MPGNLDVRIETHKWTQLRQSTGNFIENVPRIEEEMSKEFAEDLENAIKESVRNTFDQNTSTGELESNVKAERRGGNGKWQVSANAYNNGVNYAAWHEYAEDGHFVPFESNGSPNTEIIRWAKKKGVYSQTWGVEVEPRSFMKPGVQEAIRKARKRMRSGNNSASSNLQKAFGG